MAISWVGGHIGLHRSVFIMIAALSGYLLSFRLSGVLEVNTSVGCRCSTIVGEDLSVTFCVGVGRWEQTYPGLWFLPVWHGGIPDSVLLLYCVVGAGWSRGSLFPVFYVCSRRLPYFHCVLCPFLSDLFPSTSKVRLVLAVWRGNTAVGGLSRVGFSLQCCRGSPLFPVLSGVPVGHWVIKRPLKRVWWRSAWATPVSLSRVSCSGTSYSSFRSVTIGSWAQVPRDELLASWVRV